MIEHRYRVIIRCDGCNEPLGGEDDAGLFGGAWEADAAAYAAGWKFIPKRSAKGHEVASQTNVVCPGCVDTFEQTVLRPGKPAGPSDLRRRPR